MHVPGKWAVMSCTLAAGQSLRWLRDTCCAGEVAEAAKQGVDPYELMTALAEKTPIGADGLLFLPYLMGERSPINDTNARATFLGMSMDTTRSDMVQAVLEGVAFAIRDSFEVAKSLGIQIQRSKVCGGGAKSPLWRQIFANVLNLPLDIPQTEEALYLWPCWRWWAAGCIPASRIAPMR